MVGSGAQKTETYLIFIYDRRQKLSVLTQRTPSTYGRKARGRRGKEVSFSCERGELLETQDLGHSGSGGGGGGGGGGGARIQRE